MLKSLRIFKTSFNRTRFISVIDGTLWKNPKLKVLPFKLTLDDAVNRIIANTNFFENPTSFIVPVSKELYKSKTKQVFVPIITISVNNICTKYTETHFCGTSKILKSHSLPFGTKKLQLYAGYDYPKSIINDICQISILDVKHGLHNISKKYFTNSAGNCIKIEVPEYSYEYLHDELLKKLTEIEKEFVHEDIVNSHGYSHSTAIEKINFTHDKCETELWFMPLYVYECTDFNDNPVYKIINGFNGKVSGHKIVNDRISRIGKLFMSKDAISSLFGFTHVDLSNEKCDKQASNLNRYTKSDQQQMLIDEINNYNKYAGMRAEHIWFDKCEDEDPNKYKYYQNGYDHKTNVGNEYFEKNTYTYNGQVRDDDSNAWSWSWSWSSYWKWTHGYINSDYANSSADPDTIPHGKDARVGRWEPYTDYDLDSNTFNNKSNPYNNKSNTSDKKSNTSNKKSNTSDKKSNTDTNTSSRTKSYTDPKTLWCKILDIDPEKINTYNNRTLKQKYYAQMKKYHPDIYNGPQDANEKSKLINEAYEKLMSFVKP